MGPAKYCIGVELNSSEVAYVREVEDFVLLSLNKGIENNLTSWRRVPLDLNGEGGARLNIEHVYKVSGRMAIARDLYRKEYRVASELHELLLSHNEAELTPSTDSLEGLEDRMLVNEIKSKAALMFDANLQKTIKESNANHNFTLIYEQLLNELRDNTTT